MSDDTTEAPRGLTNLPYEAAPIETERLVLRPLAEGDFEDVTEYRRKRAAVVRYLHWEVHDHEESVKRLKKHMTMTRLAQGGDGLIFAVELRSRDGQRRVVGDVSIFLKSVKHAQLELGWVFHPAVHGRGYATEAARALLDLAFDTLGAHRVYAELDARNEASARLCDDLGMRREALLHESESRDGEWRDTAVYALLASEYTHIRTA